MHFYLAPNTLHSLHIRIWTIRVPCLLSLLHCFLTAAHPAYHSADNFLILQFRACLLSSSEFLPTISQLRENSQIYYILPLFFNLKNKQNKLQVIHISSHLVAILFFSFVELILTSPVPRLVPKT